MSEVKRFSVGVDGVDPNGNLVRYEDYSALQQRLEASEALMLAMRDDSRESRSKLELVVAESAALKGGILKCTEAVENWNSWADTEDKITLHTETPATDAMVNEIRAEGADLVGHALEKIPKREMHISGQRHQYIQRSEALLTAEDIANQLRADAAKGGSDD